MRMPGYFNTGAIRQRWASAKPDSWHVDRTPQNDVIIVNERGDTLATMARRDASVIDARAIANARTDIEALCEEVEACNQWIANHRNGR